MSVKCFGKKGDRYQIFESDPNVLLVFDGPDADKFQQINPPAANDPNTRQTKFSLTVDHVKAEIPGFLVEENLHESASVQEVCDDEAILHCFHYDLHVDLSLGYEEIRELLEICLNIRDDYSQLSHSQWVLVLGWLVREIYEGDPRLEGGGPEI